MIKCKKCGEAVSEECKYCSNCGAKLNYESACMKNDIRSRIMQTRFDMSIKCVQMALDIYYNICEKNVTRGDSTIEDVQKITGIAEDICELALKYKKSAKAATNAD